MSEPCLLIIDDNDRIRSGLTQLLRKQNYRVRAASTGAAGRAIFQKDAVAVALVDRILPDINGEKLIPLLLADSPETICIAITAEGSADIAVRMLYAGARDYFEKPIPDWPRFFNTIESHLALWKREQELKGLQRQVQNMQRIREDGALDMLKGNSPAMQMLLDEIRVLGPLPVPVLIRGESGTGKELVAVALHRLSQREGAFIPVNCAAIPRELFESELFGHEKGAFTGASRQREGLCAEAAHGTLFLDEVGDLPLELQAKLLRVIEQRTYRRVGSSRSEQLHARIIAATHVDLEAAIAERRFRKDLYFRVSAQEIWVPPLRERREDIQQLAFHFIQKYNRDFSRNIQRIHPRALKRLQGHSWQRNNVRELDREIQRALARCGGSEELTEQMLFRQQKPQEARAAAPEATTDILEGLLELPYREALQTARSRVARWYLRHFLDAASWNQTVAARKAHGMQRTHLSKLIRELELSRPDDAA